MIQQENINIKVFSFTQLKGLLRNDFNYNANKELANRVVQNDTEAVRYFLTDLSEPIVKHIEYDILKRDVYGDYYIFISAPVNEESVPQWKKVSQYKGDNCQLNTYVSCIACRHFCKIAQKEKEDNLRNGDMIEYVDYESLLGYDYHDEEESETSIRMRNAYNNLSEKDREVLRLLLIENMSGIEAFPVLSQYITPKPKDGMTSEQVKESWSTKQRQDAMSLLKGRALDHLKQQFLKTR